ncbi:hypothetical protein [Streptosporangium longisporum]|uniref:NUDIX hydrolase n=1 Tax=Streptosporangium longisporum TaxID=46187 RepID=A0ABP6LIE0_9ACTN
MRTRTTRGPYRPEIQRRHVFLLALHQDTPERWTSSEDHDGTGRPIRFECFWIPLEHGHVLQSGQGALLWRLFDGEPGNEESGLPGRA